MAKGDIRTGSVSSNAAAGAATTTNLQTYAQPGDLCVMILATANQAGGNRPPTGFSEIVEVPGSPLGMGTAGAIGGIRGEVYVGRFTSALENTIDWGDSGDVNVRSRWIIEGPWDAIPTIIADSDEIAANTALSFPALADVPAGAITYFVACSDRDGSSSTAFSGWACSDVTGLAEIGDYGSSTNTGCAIGTAGGIATAGGTVDGATATQDTAVNAIVFSIAIPMSSPSASLEVTPGAITYVGQEIGVGEYSLPVITRPAGGGDVDVAATVITNGYSVTPTIALAGDPESNENITGTRWEGLFANIALYQASRTPTFTLNFSNWRQTTPPANNKLYWRLGSDSGDLYAWTPFNNRSVDGSVLTVSNSTPFAEAAVQVANIPPVPYDELRAWIAAHDGHANVFRPQACVAADFGAGADAYAYYEFASQVSPDGIEVGGTLAYAIGITKPGVIPPGGKRRFFHTWTHAGEWGGLRAMMRAMDRLIAETTADDTVMVEAGEHIFLIVNTAGMVGGLARGSAEPGDLGEDTNRVWGSDATDRSDVSDPQGVVEASVALIATEWGLNGSGKINCVGQVAWHSHTFSATKFGTYKDGMTATESAVISSIETAYGTPLHNYGASSSGSSTAFARSACVGGFGITFEWSYAFADFLNEIGASVDTIIPALADAYAAGLFGETVTLDAGAITYVGQTINIPGSTTITVEPAALTYVGQEILIRNPIPVQLLPGAITYVGANITVRSGPLPEGGGLMAGRAVSPGMLLSRIWS